MRILLTGASGLIGRASRERGSHLHWDVTRLIRPGSPAASDTTFWNPGTGEIDSAGLERFDAVIHLAGEPVVLKRWSAADKRSIFDSRVNGTASLAGAIAKLKHPPRVLASASAVGFYGDRGNEILTERSPAGTGILANVCQQWEQATRPAEAAGVRVVHLRIGAVLHAHGGALKAMMPAFRRGFGAVAGNGRQFFSWISLPDTVAAIARALDDDTIRGPVNVVAPTPVTNREFAIVLATALGSRARFRIPAWVLNLTYGELSGETILASQRVLPEVLAPKMKFQHATIDAALAHALKSWWK